MPQSAASRPQPTGTDVPEMGGRKPVDKFRDGPVQVSIWQNDGPTGSFRTASFELRYRDRDEQWQTGRSYSSSALLHLESAAREAHSRIEKWQQASARSNSPRPKVGG